MIKYFEAILRNNSTTRTHRLLTIATTVKPLLTPRGDTYAATAFPSWTPAWKGEVVGSRQTRTPDDPTARSCKFSQEYGRSGFPLTVAREEAGTGFGRRDVLSNLLSSFSLAYYRSEWSCGNGSCSNVFSPRLCTLK